MQKVRRLFINTKRNQFEEGRCSKRKEKKLGRGRNRPLERRGRIEKDKCDNVPKLPKI